MLSELQLGEFIYEQPAVGDIEYTFKHALTHEVAYHSVLNERRRLLHERIGAALESIYADSLDDHVAELAHHYARSGNPGKAVEYCLRAVQQCVVRASYAEAVAQFEAGLEQLQRLPDDDRRAELELDLRNAARGALATIKGYSSPEAEQSSARAMELCQRPGINWEKTWSALQGVYMVQMTRPDLREAGKTAAELIARAEEHGSAEHIAAATDVLAFNTMVSGDFESRRRRLRPGVGAVGIHSDAGNGSYAAARRANATVKRQRLGLVKRSPGCTRTDPMGSGLSGSGLEREKASSHRRSRIPGRWPPLAWHTTSRRLGTSPRAGCDVPIAGRGTWALVADIGDSSSPRGG